MIFFVLFGNDHFHNVILTFPNVDVVNIDVVNIDVENDNVVSTLSNVVQINDEVHPVNLALFNVVKSNVGIRYVVATLI